MSAKRILVYFHPTSSTQVSWVITDENNQKIKSVYNGDLNEFPSDTQDYRIVVFVPCEHILLTSVQLPKLSQQRLLQALPFALEEQLIQDVEELHFAIGPHQADASWPVAVVAKNKMEAWLRLCEEIKISPSLFIPSIFLIPYAEKIWKINIDRNHCLIRTGRYDGFACEKPNLDILLDLRLNEESDKSAIHMERLERSELAWVEEASKQPAFPEEINLLQGEYQPKVQATQVKKLWALTGYLALALIALGFFSQIVSYFILHREAVKIETAINTIYKKNFPQAKSVVAPRERMNEKLHGLTGISNKQGLLLLLGQIGKALSETKNIRIQHLDFRDPQVTLEVTTNDFANLDQFTGSLKKENLDVKQQNAATEQNQVKATIIIHQNITG